MIIFFLLFVALLLALLVAAYFWNRRLETQLAERDRVIASQDKESERMRQHFESEKFRIYNESLAAVANAQKLVEQQVAEMNQEAARIRQHFETEARRIQADAEKVHAKDVQELELLRKYQSLRDAEGETQRILAEAVDEANNLRAEARILLAQSRTAAAGERTAALQKVKSIHEQADARLNQALQDAGRIVTDAETRAVKIGGDAYTALQNKELLEQAAEAMRNIIEGYGDRYLVPTHSLLDELAAEYGYDAAGQSLASRAGTIGKRMIEARGGCKRAIM